MSYKPLYLANRLVDLSLGVINPTWADNLKEAVKMRNYSMPVTNCTKGDFITFGHKRTLAITAEEPIYLPTGFRDQVDPVIYLMFQGLANGQRATYFHLHIKCADLTFIKIEERKGNVGLTPQVHGVIKDHKDYTVGGTKGDELDIHCPINNGSWEDMKSSFSEILVGISSTTSQQISLDYSIIYEVNLKPGTIYSKNEIVIVDKFITAGGWTEKTTNGTPYGIDRLSSATRNIVDTQRLRTELLSDSDMDNMLIGDKVIDHTTLRSGN